MKKLFALIILMTGFISAQAVYKTTDIKPKKLNNANGKLRTIGDSVRFYGVVQSPINFLAGQYVVLSLRDSTDAIMVLYQGGGGRNYFNGIKMGDSIKVRGRMDQLVIRYGMGPSSFRDSTGMTVCVIDSNAAMVNSGNAIGAPKAVKNLKERWESHYVNLDSFQLKSSSQWKQGPGGNFGSARVTIVRTSNASDSEWLYIPNTVIGNIGTPKGGFSVRGYEIQDDGQVSNGQPFDKGYMLWVTDTSYITLYQKPVVLNHKINEVKTYNTTTYTPDSIGIKCILRGVVQSINYAPSVANFGPGGGTNKGTIFSIFDNTGSILVVHDASKFGYDPALGDSITITGTINQPIAPFPGSLIYSATTTIKPTDMMLGSISNPVLAPKEVTALSEDDESKLVILKNVYLADQTQWDTSNSQNKLRVYVTVTNGKDSFYVRVPRLDTSSPYFLPVPTGTFDLIGIEVQNDNSSPYTGSYMLMPRFKTDFIPVIKLTNIKDVKINNNKGENTSYGKKVYIQGTVHSKDFVATEHFFSIADKTGAIMVYAGSSLGYSCNIGDIVKVKGTISQVNGQSEIDADSIYLISQGNKTWIQNSISARALDEVDESYLTEAKGLTLTNAADWDKSKTTYLGSIRGYKVKAYNANSDSFTIFVSDMTDVWGCVAPAANFTMRGIVIQDDQQLPYTDSYILLPRALSDIDATNGIEEKQVSTLSAYPNPVKDNLYISVSADKNDEAIVSVYDVTGKMLYRNMQHLSTGKQNIEILTSQLAAGLYTCKLITASGKTYKTDFIKE